MFMADLCYIFIVEQIWRKTSLLYYYRISIFFKETSKSNMTVLTQSISGIA